MKKLTLLFFMTAFIASISFAQESSAWEDRPEGYEPEKVEGYENQGDSRALCNFLVFRDNLPWGSSAVSDILTANGETFLVSNSAGMATIDFSLYGVIIIESDQVPGFHTNFTANFAKFDAFVSAGGRLEVHAATAGWNSGPIPVQLPGGVWTVNFYDNNNTLVNLAHPIVAGVSDPFYGNYASHGYFTSMVPGTDVITASQINGEPTTIQYSWGLGTVTATCCTYEYGYSNGQDAGIMLENNLDYSCGGYVPPTGVPVSNWAIILGVLLIGAFMVVRYRRRLA